MAEEHVMRMHPDQVKDVLTRLRRAQGQLAGVISMIESERECAEILPQLAAVSKAVNRAGFRMIACGIKGCLEDPSATDDDLAAIERMFMSLS